VTCPPIAARIATGNGGAPFGEQPENAEGCNFGEICGGEFCGHRVLLRRVILVVSRVTEVSLTRAQRAREWCRWRGEALRASHRTVANTY